MKRISGGQLSRKAKATLLSSHAGGPRAATGDTSFAGQARQTTQPGRASPPPAREPTAAVGRHRPDQGDSDSDSTVRLRAFWSSIPVVWRWTCETLATMRRAQARCSSIVDVLGRRRISHARSSDRRTRGRSGVGSAGAGAPGAGAEERSAQAQCDTERDETEQEPGRVDQDERQAADAEAVEQPDRVAAGVGGEEAGRDFAGASAPHDLTRLQQHGRGGADSVEGRNHSHEFWLKPRRRVSSVGGQGLCRWDVSCPETDWLVCYSIQTSWYAT